MKHISSISVSLEEAKPHNIANFSQIPSWVMSSKKLTSTQKIVFGYLFTFNIQGKIAFPSNKKIAESCGLTSPRTAQDAITKLERFGFIVRTYEEKPNFAVRESIHCALRPEEIGDVPVFVKKPNKTRKRGTQ